MISIFVVAMAFATAWAQSSATASGGEPNRKLYNFNFVNMDFAAAFNSLSATAGVDILIAPDVSGRLSLQVTNKTWQETLDIICNLHELIWLVEDKYILIQKLSTYQAKQKKIADQEAQLEQTVPLVRKNFQVHHAKASDLVKVLDNMKSTRGRITTVDRTNSIIVYDTDGRIEQMENALKELDVETLQIMITAKLMVVDSRRARELGVDWSASMGTMALTPGAASVPATGVPVGASRISGAISSFPNNGMSPGVLNPSTAITASVLDNHLQMAVATIMADASTEVLASPQISTLDNTQAVIFMGDKISIRVIDDNGESSTQLVETGIKLTVTPHVSGDNRILLDLYPQNNSYSYDQKGEVVISTQEAQTKVVVADGETVVIGGLTKNEDAETETGIPFLKDIPVLGHLFKYSKKEITKKDLVIFVTPRIIRNYIGDVLTSEPAVVSGAPAKAAPQPVAPQKTQQTAVQQQPKVQTQAAPPPPAPQPEAAPEEGDWE